MEAAIKKIPNTQGTYTLQYNDRNNKLRIVHFKTLEDGLCFINSLSDSKAELIIKGQKTLVYKW